MLFLVCWLIIFFWNLCLHYEFSYLSLARAQRALFCLALLCSCMPFHLSNLIEVFTTRHDLWSTSSIRGDRDPPVVQKQHKTVLFPFHLTPLQLCATRFPYCVFFYLVSWKGIFRILKKCPVCPHLSTYWLSELHHFFIERELIFHNKKIVPLLLVCYDTNAEGFICQCLPVKKTPIFNN